MADADVVTAMTGSFLGKLSPDLIGLLLAGGLRSEDPAATTIYREGSAPRTLLVVGGLLRVYMSSPEGRHVTVRYARGGDVLGIAVLVGGPADVGAQTLEESTLFRVDGAVLKTAARSDGRVAWALAEELNRRLYENLHQTAVNAFGSVRQRVSLHLLDLASAQQSPRGLLVVRASQQELADAVGSVREVVARVLVLLFVGWNGWALWLFRIYETGLLPGQATHAMIEVGPYGLSRNPLYVGLLTLYLGLALRAPTFWGLVLFPAAVLLVLWGAIRPEERFLRERFGTPFDDYARRVRRWL